MERYYKKYTLSSLFVSVLLMFVSILLMFKPTELINFIVIMFSLIITFDGIVHIISYFRMPKEFTVFNFELIEGVLQILLGILTFLKPEWISTFFPIFIGIWIIFSSVIKLQLSLNLKQVDSNNWIMLLVISIITFLLGLLIVFNPIESIITISALGGVILFLTELINIIEYIYLLVKFRKMKL